jgi:hypothetical protein
VKYPEKSIPLVQHFTDTSSQVKGFSAGEWERTFNLAINCQQTRTEYSLSIHLKPPATPVSFDKLHINLKTHTYITPDDCPIADWFFVEHVRFMGSLSNDNHLKYFPLIVCFVTNLLT